MIAFVVFNGDDLKTGKHEFRVNFAFLDKRIVRSRTWSVVFEHLSEQFLKICFLYAGAQKQKRPLPEYFGERAPEVQITIRDSPVFLVSNNELFP